MTPDPGLREAAERLSFIENSKGVTLQQVYGLNWLGKHQADLTALANFAASLLDSTPATVEWLEEQGIRRHLGSHKLSGQIYFVEHYSKDIHIYTMNDFDAEGRLVLVSPTRGAVRALQLALSPKEDGNG